MGQHNIWFPEFGISYQPAIHQISLIFKTQRKCKSPRIGKHLNLINNKLQINISSKRSFLSKTKTGCNEYCQTGVHSASQHVYMWINEVFWHSVWFQHSQSLIKQHFLLFLKLVEHKTKTINEIVNIRIYWIGKLK